ncbi:MAG: hypothetical protein LBP75_10385 [Planctomycetota bacterium]|jgi:hypothetical protein|nr:hypothetical protein [Planctomycetota bacterium]
MYSIYHFFRHLATNKNALRDAKKLEYFPFAAAMLACRNVGQFPDLAIKMNHPSGLFTGGELIELKDSRSYSVASFNSTIPTGQKAIAQIIKSENSAIKRQMEEAGNHVYSLPIREVFYLVRGRHRGNTKVCLTHGSFFETVKAENLIAQSFAQVLQERLTEKNLAIGDDLQTALSDIFSEQESFSRGRNLDKASVKLRFRIMTEVKAEGNILNSRQYPALADNTLNLIVPLHNEDDEKLARRRFAASGDEKQFRIFRLKHHLNGYFLVFQQSW